MVKTKKYPIRMLESRDFEVREGMERRVKSEEVFSGTKKGVEEYIGNKKNSSIAIDIGKKMIYTVQVYDIYARVRACAWVGGRI